MKHLTIPEGLCIVELLGHRKLRGTVHVEYLGPVPMLFVTSEEPGEVGTVHGPFGPLAVYCGPRPMTLNDLKTLAADVAYHERCESERRIRAQEEAEEKAQVLADAPKFVHLVLTSDDGPVTACKVPAAGLCGLSPPSDGYDCPHCLAEEEICF